MNKKTDFKLLHRLFETKEKFLLTSHQDPDGDSIGSLLGLDGFLVDLGKKTVMFNEGRLPQKYRFLDPTGAIRFSPGPLEFVPQVAIILECPELERIGFVRQYLTRDMTMVNIDHHQMNKMFGDLNYIDESACAVSEILYDILISGGYKISSETAKRFYAAIASDTGRFKFSNTSASCFRVASELVDAGANPKEIADKIFSSFSAGTLKLLGHLLETLELHDGSSICTLKLTSDDLRKYNVQVEDTEGIIDYAMLIEGVKVGILFKDYNRAAVRVSLRSQNGIDIGEYARRKGGGGHPNAAGFSLNKPLDKAVVEVVAEVSEHING